MSGTPRSTPVREGRGIPPLPIEAVWVKGRAPRPGTTLSRSGTSGTTGAAPSSATTDRERWSSAACACRVCSSTTAARSTAGTLAGSSKDNCATSWPGPRGGISRCDRHCCSCALTTGRRSGFARAARARAPHLPLLLTSEWREELGPGNPAGLMGRIWQGNKRADEERRLLGESPAHEWKTTTAEQLETRRKTHGRSRGAPISAGNGEAPSDLAQSGLRARVSGRDSCDPSGACDPRSARWAGALAR